MIESSSFRLSLSLKKNKSSLKDNDKNIINGIHNNSNQIMIPVYQQNFVKIKKMVRLFRNTTLDPEDIFQEGLTRTIMNIRAGKFKENSSFATYLYGICRNICLKQLSKIQTTELKQNQDFVEEDNHFNLLDNLLKVKEQMDDRCKTIIDLRFSLKGNIDKGDSNKCYSFDEISDKLHLSAANARQRFKRCIDKLRERISSTPELKEYFA